MFAMPVVGSVVTVVEPMYVWPWPKPEGSGTRLLKNWIRNVLPATLVSVPVTFVPVPPPTAPVSARRGLSVVGRTDQNDALLSVGIDAVGEDRVAGSGLDKHASRDVERDDVALVGTRSADRVVRRTGTEDDAVDLVPQRRRSRDVGADVASFHDIARRGCAVDFYPVQIGGNHIEGRRGGASHRIVGASFDEHALVGVAAGRRAGPVDADEITSDQVAGGRGTIDQNAHQVARDDLRALAVALDDDAGGTLDIDAGLGVAQVGLSRGVGADQVADDRDMGGAGPRDQDADQVGGDDVAGADRGPRGRVGDTGLIVAQDGAPAGGEADVLLATVLPRASAPVMLTPFA